MSLFGSDLKKFARHAKLTIAGLVLAAGIGLSAHDALAGCVVVPSEKINQVETSNFKKTPFAYIMVKPENVKEVITHLKDKFGTSYGLSYKDGSLFVFTEGEYKGKTFVNADLKSVYEIRHKLEKITGVEIVIEKF